MAYKRLSTFAITMMLVVSVSVLSAGEIKWLSIGDIQNWFSSTGCETEVGRTGQTSDQLDGLRYPALYSSQDVQAAKGLWLGCKGYNDPTKDDQLFEYKVVNSGPRLVDETATMMTETFDLIGKRAATVVQVDGSAGKFIGNFDVLDSVDPDLPCDRMINNVINTSLGITITRKIMAFSNHKHQNYFIYEYTLENTGIYNVAGAVKDQDLSDVILYLQYRLAVNREASTYELGILEQASTWGKNTMNHNFGRNGNWGDGVQETLNIQGKDITYDVPFRGFFVWQGSNYTKATSEAADFGAPYSSATLGGDDRLTSVQFPGVVVIHADKSTSDSSDDPMQPTVNGGIASDLSPHQTNKDQYDANTMASRYEYMSGEEPVGWMDKSHAQYVNDAGIIPLNNLDDWPGNGGGISAAMGFGPYDIAHGESVKIVLAEAVGSLDMAQRRQVGLDYASGALTLEEKNDAVRSSRDSLFQGFQRAYDNYTNDFDVPFPPEAPSEFYVVPQGDRITLQWKRNSETSVGFSGYRLYRALSEYDSTYHLILDTNDPASIASEEDPTFCEYGDKTAVRGFDYYYYIEAYDDGGQDIDGEVLYSSKYETLTNTAAQLKRPPGTALKDVRIVPNPYNVRAQLYQFGQAGGQKDRIMFYNIPPQCSIRVYSERGDLVWETEHVNNSGDEAWNSVTSSRQVIVSGVYIAVIEVTEDYEDEATGEVLMAAGEQIIKKFLIVR